MNMMSGKTEIGRTGSLWAALLALCMANTIPGVISTYIHLLSLAFMVYILLLHLLLKRAPMDTRLLLLGLAWMIIQLLTLVLSPLPVNLFVSMRSVVMYAVRYFALFGLIALLPLSRHDMEKFFKGYALFATLASCFSLAIHYRSILSIRSLWQNAAPVNFAPYGMNRNTFAGYLYLALAAILYLILRLGRKRYYLYAAVISITLLFTFSRAAIASLLIFLYLFIILYKKLRWPQSALLALLLAVLFFLLLRSQLGDLIKYFLIRSEGKTSGRGALWRIGLEAFFSSPLFGRGFGSSPAILSAAGSSFSYFHNMYLEILASGGLVFFSLMTALVVHMFRVYKWIMNHDRLTGILLISLMVSLLVYGFFESVLFFDSKISLMVTVPLITMPTLYLNFLRRTNQLKEKRPLAVESTL